MSTSQPSSGQQPLDNHEDWISTTERDIAACKDRLAILEDRVHVVEQVGTKSNAVKPLVLCLIDGDGCIFNENLLADGLEGGLSAADKLKDHILNDYGKECTLLVNIFMNGWTLRRRIEREFKIKDATTRFFFEGFNVPAYMSMVDVGGGKEAADKKIIENMRIFSHDPHVDKIYFGGGHDGGYAYALNEMREKGHLNKIVLVHYTEICPTIKAFNLPCLDNNGLFLFKNLPNNQGTSSNTASPMNRNISLP